MHVRQLFGSREEPALVLAPMVRAGTLPLRLAALHFGARTTWSEELIAKRLRTCRRVENAQLGTIDFVSHSHGNKETLAYQTCALERGRNILQIGVASPEEAEEAARIVMNDVAGIDVNCGCPQHFSLSGGMGAALLSKPCVTADIVKTLKRIVPQHVTVSCKIRLHETAEETIAFIKHLEQAGVDAVTIHARRIPERPRDRARWDELETIVQSVSIPIVVNGDVFTRKDVERILQQVPSASGVMFARGAIADVSEAFSGRPQTITEAMRVYLNFTEVCTLNFSNTKWFASQVIRYRTDDADFHVPRKHLNESVTRAKTLPDLYAAFGVVARSDVKLEKLWEGLDKSTAEGWAVALNRLTEESENIYETKRVRLTQEGGGDPVVIAND